MKFIQKEVTKLWLLTLQAGVQFMRSMNPQIVPLLGLRILFSNSIPPFQMTQIPSTCNSYVVSLAKTTAFFLEHKLGQGSSTVEIVVFFLLSLHVLQLNSCSNTLTQGKLLIGIDYKTVRKQGFRRLHHCLCMVSSQ